MSGVGKLYDPAADEEDRMRDLMEERGGGFNKGLTTDKGGQEQVQLDNMAHV